MENWRKLHNPRSLAEGLLLNNVDREIFACTNIRPLNFHVVLFTSFEHIDVNEN